MVELGDIHPLTGFLRDHKAHIERLASTGRPEVLTVNGKARVVVQDAEAYQKMMASLDAAETERIVRERLAAVERGEAGVPARKVLADVRKRLGLKRAGTKRK
jgi:PHD/YefM family antitoxin component YafN of YafNO toxin-antitoxin module